MGLVPLMLGLAHSKDLNAVSVNARALINDQQFCWDSRRHFTGLEISLSWAARISLSPKGVLKDGGVKYEGENYTGWLSFL